MPKIHAVRQHPNVSNEASVEKSPNGGHWVADAPEEEEGNGRAPYGESDRVGPIVLKSGTETLRDEGDSGRYPPDSCGGPVDIFKAWSSFEQSKSAAEHKGIRMDVKCISVVDVRIVHQKAGDTDKGRGENDSDRNPGRKDSPDNAWAAQAQNEDERPDEIKLLFQAEGPEVL